MGGNIRGYEEQFMQYIAAGEFSVDGEGRIWRHFDRRSGRLSTPRRAERGERGGYMQVRFFHEGKRLAATAHRIVFRVLKGPIPAGCEVNHDNGIKDDNRPNNLLSETPSGNKKHASRNGLHDQYGRITRKPNSPIIRLRKFGSRTPRAASQWSNWASASRFHSGQSQK